MVLEDNLVELNKQEIFHQIDREILSQKKNKFSILQKTRSNYKFIVYLDFIACFIALIGVIIVYNVFREQQIRLVSGQGGVKVLETTLIEEIYKQYEQDFILKELEVQALRKELENMEQIFADTLLKINEEAQQKFENERALLEVELLFELTGKNKTEQDTLRREYNQKLNSLRKEIDDTRLETETLEREKFEQLQQEQQIQGLKRQEELQRQLKEAQQKFETSKEKLEVMKIEQPQMVVDSILLSNTIRQIQRIEQKISDDFIVIQQNISEEKYIQAEKILDDIENIYTGELPDTYPETRKKSDLSLIALNREFINKNKETIVLNKQIDIQSNQIEVLELGIANFEDNKNSKDSREIAEKMRNFIRQVSNNRISRKELQQQINSINKELPEATDFAYAYVEFIQNDNNSNIPKSINEKMQKILNKEKQNSLERKIIYLKNPDGFVLDILDEKRVLVNLIPGKRVSRNQELKVFRIISQDTFQMDEIGYIKVLKSGGNIIQTSNTDYDIKIGDLIYIKD